MSWAELLVDGQSVLDARRGDVVDELADVGTREVFVLAVGAAGVLAFEAREELGARTLVFTHGEAAALHGAEKLAVGLREGRYDVGILCHYLLHGAHGLAHQEVAYRYAGLGELALGLLRQLVEACVEHILYHGGDVVHLEVCLAVAVLAGKLHVVALEVHMSTTGICISLSEPMA